jgi:RNA polymerase sporulation-specific sigma factor
MTGSEGKRLPAPTPPREIRLIRAARHGDRHAQSELLALYEPLVQAIVGGLYLRGGEREDLAQHARLGIAKAIRDWDPTRRVPFKPFARLCAIRETKDAYEAGGARKHAPLNAARPLDSALGALEGRRDHEQGLLEERLAAIRPDEDPVVKTLARERLRDICARVPTLSTLEHDALALSANDRSYREIAGTLGIGQRAVSNALQRARGKLIDRAA